MSQTQTMSDKRRGPGRPAHPVSDISPRIRCLTVADLVRAGLGSKTDIYRKVAAKEFPAPFHHGGKTLWREATISAWLDKKQAIKAR